MITAHARPDANTKVRPVVGALVGLLVGVLALLIAIFFTKGGHGSYLPAAALFPYSMLTASAVGEIAWPLLTLALLQFPLYGYLWLARIGRRAAIFVVHLVAAVGACIVVLTSAVFR